MQGYFLFDLLQSSILVIQCLLCHPVMENVVRVSLIKFKANIIG